MSPRVYQSLVTSTAALTTRISLAGLVAVLASPPADANPLGGNVVGGTAAIQGQGTSSVTINQSSQNAIINWATFSANAANKGTQNVIDPLKMAWELAAQQKNSFAATFDQRLFPGISFFATGFYSNRRVEEIAPAVQGQGINGTIKTFTVPTTNPYYPTNAPATLRVSYDFARELPPTIPAYELSYRYQFGLNLDLPFGWNGQVFDSRSYESNVYTINTVNDNAVNVALGNTVSSASAT